MKIIVVSNVAYQFPQLHVVAKVDVESDTDDDEEEFSVKFNRNSSSGYELVGKDTQSETTSEGYFPSSGSVSHGFEKSKKTLVEVGTTCLIIVISCLRLLEMLKVNSNVLHIILPMPRQGC